MESNAEAVFRYFPEFSLVQREQINKLGELYPAWNEKINVISRKDIQNLYVHHVLHSLAIAKFLPGLPDGTKILDLGTGGGFPGIPLAIAMPQCHFHLIDRIGKKIKVATEVAASIGLKNVTFQHGDIAECKDKYDYVVSRAVMPLDNLIPLIRKNIRHDAASHAYAMPNGLICLKGGELTAELKASARIASEPLVDSLINYFPEEPFFETKKLVYQPL